MIPKYAGLVYQLLQVKIIRGTVNCEKGYLACHFLYTTHEDAGFDTLSLSSVCFPQEIFLDLPKPDHTVTSKQDIDKGSKGSIGQDH